MNETLYYHLIPAPGWSALVIDENDADEENDYVAEVFPLVGWGDAGDGIVGLVAADTVEPATDLEGFHLYIHESMPGEQVAEWIRGEVAARRVPVTDP